MDPGGRGEGGGRHLVVLKADCGYSVCVMSVLRLVTFQNLYFVTKDPSCKASPS